MISINKKYLIAFSLLVLGVFSVITYASITLANNDLSTRLAGRILLQVEEQGQAWYVNPGSNERIFLNRPLDAFNIMRSYGLGISEANYAKFSVLVPENFNGRILLRVEANGEAYYVSPRINKLIYLGRPSDAFHIMTEEGLGITNADLETIPIGKLSNSPSSQETNTNMPISQDEKNNISMPEPQEKTPAKIIPEETEQEPSEPEIAPYPWHNDITATVFWVGEPIGNGSSEDNDLSAWDDDWRNNFGGYDDPFCRNGYFPCDFNPRENPFYVALPFDDFDNGKRKAEAYEHVPWANEKAWGERESMMKNRWVRIEHNGNTCYAQVEDTGPYKYNDYEYVFNAKSPINTRANGTGMDVSPATRDCLGFTGENNADNKINWQFVEASDVPTGPWTKNITTSQINWPQ